MRVNSATGGTFTLTFNGQTTAPIPFDATAAQTQAALEALSNIGDQDINVTGNAINTGELRPSSSTASSPSRTSRCSRPTTAA